MGRWVILVALVGCGRFGFANIDGDASGAADVPTHDEDGDGVPDVVDVCPHKPDPDQTDSDGDGVGDACDPEIANPRQSIVYFDPLITQPFEVSGQMGGGTLTPTGDSVIVDTLGGYIDFQITLAIQSADIELAGEITQVGGYNRQVALQIFDTFAQPYSYGELYDTTTTNHVAQVSYFDGSSYGYYATTPLATGIHTGAFVMHLAANVGTPSTLALDVGWPGDMYTPNANAPAYAGGTHVGMTVFRSVLEIRYIVVIATN